jgi:hypothetical protein
MGKGKKERGKISQGHKSRRTETMVIPFLSTLNL